MKMLMSVAHPTAKRAANKEVTDQDNIIEPGDNVRVHSGRHAGERGTAIDVTWYSDLNGVRALVRVMSDEGISDFYDMHMLEKVKGHLDDPPSDPGERTWKHVK